MTNSFDFTVSVSSEEWAYTQRRLIYLESVLLRVVRDESKVQEWFSAADLARKALPGLPPTKAAITRKAKAEQWRRLHNCKNGRWQLAYHVSSLPARAFDDLVARILDLPEIDVVVPDLPDLPNVEPLPVADPGKTAPPWVLPLMRIMKVETAGDIGQAWDILPERLPAGVLLPSVEEAANVLVQLGLAGK
ncbi:hypothetical protein IFT84_17730 [Rhizobium sp. CFBP 8762]|uniref:DNA-binding protein n=1 Tax=Rhizobium sp. CFBP 8762 TaxID=2775279 RepID=UPI00177E2F68|nr:DNA-binding protein [Rhizobium sp. CFBP 8762]MBD8556352.1 hypothetical protein [Rhizobium sp. CFBP 8762]